MFPSAKQLSAAALLVVTCTTGLYLLLGRAERTVAAVSAVPVQTIGAVGESLVEVGRKIARDVKDLTGLTPTVTVGDTKILGEKKAIRELATASESFSCGRTWECRWLGSQKNITVKATFLAKAGFDLGDDFEIRIEDDMVTVTVPGPKVLSVEPTGDFQFEGASGWWNYVSDDDRSQITSELLALARKSTEGGGITQAARANLRETWGTIIKSRMGQGVRILFREG